MCGIFGFSGNTGAIELAEATKLLNRFFHYSEKRGREACGLSIRATSDNVVSVYKTNKTASVTIATKSYQNFLGQFFNPVFTGEAGGFVALGHARMVTNGMEDNNEIPARYKSNSTLSIMELSTTLTPGMRKAAHNSLFVVDTEVINSLLTFI